MYEHSIKSIRGLLRYWYPDVVAVFFEDASEAEKTPDDLAAHLLAMLDMVEGGEMDEGKAGRWMGWVYRSLEAPPLQLIDNQQVRNWARQDGHALKEAMEEERLQVLGLLEYFVMGCTPEECPYLDGSCMVSGKPCAHQGEGPSFSCVRRYKATLAAAQKCAEEGRSLVGG
jgi:hypothetical protein